MKQVLSLLTAFIFLQMQTWALSGGPVYPTPQKGAPNVAGVYSGVMVQEHSKFGSDFQGSEFNSGTQENFDLPAGNIGVYSVTVPISGVSSGTVLLFVNGTMFTGNLTGVADPDKGTFDGLFSLTSVPTLTDAQGNILNPAAQGQMRTKIIESLNVAVPGRANLANGSAARMKGKAIIDVSIQFDFNLTPIPLVQAEYSVSGYRQVATALP